ncbi:MAG: hypothetical protein HYV40_04970 [Candidatus Levybacteria bacterium]|nr:hypothetical protein [Candidatus Levybacteria bacterium]
MKIQDIVFVLVFVFLAFKRNPIYPALAGIMSLLLAIPLFTFWIFFTAERLTWYAGAFFFLAIVLSLVSSQGKKR